MYTRRSALANFNSLRLKLCRTRNADFPYSIISFVRNLSTATERSDGYSNFDGSVSENQLDYRSFNQNRSVDGYNFGKSQQEQNTGVVYGQRPYGKFYTERSDYSNGNYVNNTGGHLDYSNGDQCYQSHGVISDGGHENLSSGCLNGQPGNFASGNQNVVLHSGNLNGYDGGGIGCLPQNHVETWQPSSRDHFSQRREIPWQSAHNAGMYQQNAGGIYYPNDGANYQPDGSGLRTAGVIGSQALSDPDSNVDSAESNVRNQSKGRLEDLDELIKEENLKEAVALLELLEQEGFQVDLPRYISLMKACGEKEALEEAKYIHKHLLKSMPNLEVRIYNRILQMYSRCGFMDDAFAVFDSMPKRNMTSWDIMISGLAKNGLGEDSVELFAEFKQSGLRPDAQLFLGLFSACGVLSDVVEGMLHFESMKKDYGIVPSMKHYVGIVAMLGSAGCLDEALEFIENMPMEPSVDIWETLMRFSRIHGNVELGDRCAEIVELVDSSRLNEQSRAGLIPISAAELAREKEKKKLTGQSLLDVRGRVHEYRAGDRSHPDADKLYALLRGLKQQMKEVGYIPETKFVLHDIDQESKEEALMAHSERLAAAQGLLTSAARAPMRIIKNLRVCGDCHNAFKIISKIVGRLIIARDTKRFHHFQDGSCSCNDYW